MSSRFASISNQKIVSISDKPFAQNKDFIIVEVPQELKDISSGELIHSFSYRDSKFFSKAIKKQAKDIKLAIITNWGEKCGIGTYSQNLYKHIIPQVKDYKIFAEDSSINNNQFNTEVIDPAHIVHCWKRGESLQALVVAIKKFNPDIISIQHEFGLWKGARHWLSFISQLSDYRTIVTMHSVFHHIDKVVFEAAMPEIIVHSDAAKQVLQDEKTRCSNRSNSTRMFPMHRYF